MAELTFKNNNPGNIRYNPKIKGVIGRSPGGFSVFSSWYHGLYAMKSLLTRSYLQKGFDTISKIIYRYAPPSENDTEKYIRNLVSWTNIPRDRKITTADLNVLIPAIVRQETSKKITPADMERADRIGSGLELAPISQETTKKFLGFFGLGSLFLWLFNK